MTGRQRVLATLDRHEPDRVPFDLGASNVTGIHSVAYQALRDHLGLPGPARTLDVRLGIVRVDVDIKDRLSVDAALVSPRGPSPGTWTPLVREAGDYLELKDEYGITWRMPRPGGLYFDMVDTPLAGDITVGDVERYPWPDPVDPNRFVGMREHAHRVVTDEKRAAVFGGMSTGIFELAQRMRGVEQFLMDALTDLQVAEALLDKALELKLRYWGRLFEEVGDTVDVVYDTDDYGTQRGLLISPTTWRALIKPRLATLNAFIHSKSRARVFLHSCGAIREIIPDLIDAGVDILNPLQVSAVGMDTKELKREFGHDLTFWGGGIDTQRVLPKGTVQEIRDEVRRHVTDLMPGGGFVFATVHNIQADVPPENVVAMWEAFQSCAGYGASASPSRD